MSALAKAKELAAKLRKYAKMGARWMPLEVAVSGLTEAADLIEAQAAELERVKAELENAHAAEAFESARGNDLDVLLIAATAALSERTRALEPFAKLMLDEVALCERSLALGRYRRIEHDDAVRMYVAVAQVILALSAPNQGGQADE